MVQGKDWRMVCLKMTAEIRGSGPRGVSYQAFKPEICIDQPDYGAENSLHEAVTALVGTSDMKFGLFTAR
jgi:hypothetical protein